MESRFVGPGKLFESEEEEFAERIELWEWASQKTDEELQPVVKAVEDVLSSR